MTDGEDPRRYRRVVNKPSLHVKRPPQKHWGVLMIGAKLLIRCIGRIQT